MSAGPARVNGKAAQWQGAELRIRELPQPSWSTNDERRAHKGEHAKQNSVASDFSGKRDFGLSDRGLAAGGGAGPSVWQRFCHAESFAMAARRRRVRSHRRYVDDVALMHRLGMQAYRFSTS